MILTRCGVFGLRAACTFAITLLGATAWWGRGGAGVRSRREVNPGGWAAALSKRATRTSYVP